MKFPRVLEWMVNLLDPQKTPDFDSREVGWLVEEIKQARFSEVSYHQRNLSERVFGRKCEICSGRARPSNGLILFRQYIGSVIISSPTDYTGRPQVFYRPVTENHVVHTHCLKQARDGEFDHI